MLVLLTLASIGAGWIVAGRALRPISRITAAARGISDRTLHERIALDGPRDELRELAETFDTMLARLEGAFESRKRFVASASHELLTPIAIVRAELEVTLADPDAGARELRAMAMVIGETNARMERLIGSLLTLASSEAGRRAAPARRPRRRRARRRSPASPRWARTDRSRCARTSIPAPVLGDAVLLDQIAANLIQNAVRYNVDGRRGRGSHGAARRARDHRGGQQRRRRRPRPTRRRSASPSGGSRPHARARPAGTASASRSCAASRRRTGATSRSARGPGAGSTCA